jgi:hypothetical protein
LPYRSDITDLHVFLPEHLEDWALLRRDLKASRPRITRPIVAQLLRDAHAPEPRYWTLLMEAIDHVGHYGMKPHKPTAGQAARSALAAKHRRAANMLKSAASQYIGVSLKTGRPRDPTKKIRKLCSLLDEFFPVRAELRPGWYSMGLIPETFHADGTPRPAGDEYVEYYGRELWHHAAVRLFFAYRNAVDPNCGVSRNGPAIKFVQSVIEACGLGRYEVGAIELMLIRAIRALERHRTEL